MSATDALLENVVLGQHAQDTLYGRIFVVSAYAGITDKLLDFKHSGTQGVYALFANDESEWAWGDAISKVGHDMLKINAGIFNDDGQRAAADQFVRERVEGVRSCLIDLHRLCSYGHFSLPEHLETVRELLASLGEAHSAYNLALLLNSQSVNARFIDLTGWRDDTELCLDERIKAAFHDLDLNSVLPIATGYAHCAGGIVKRHGRGYTEFTFSRIAALTEASEAIIHKEFHLSSADPKIVGPGRVQTIGQTNYDVTDQLANLGMEAIHPSAAKNLRQAGIPLRIKNTFDASDTGTIINSDYVSSSPQAEIVTGIRGVYAVQFFEQDMVGVKGYDAKILKVLKRHPVRVITKSSNANTIVHYLAGAPSATKRVINELTQKFESSSITTRKVAIVSAIGSDLNLHGLTATAVSSLSSADIEILGVHQLLRDIDILFIIDEADYEHAIKALHLSLIEKGTLESAELRSDTLAA